MNNLIPTDELIEWLCKPEKLRLWMMFCQAFDEDMPTACAATGALANLAIDERLGEAMAKKEDSLKILIELATCGKLDLEHRAVVSLLYLIDSWPGGEGKNKLIEAGAVSAFEKVVRDYPDSAVAQVAKDGLEVLNK